jgi:alkylated DNA repair dioxygenase AlkB
MQLVAQRSLFAHAVAEPAIAPMALVTASREQLDRWSWIDVVAGFVTGADAVFDAVVDAVEWKTTDRWMYDRMVSEPRLHGRPPHLPVLTAARQALRVHYGESLDRGACNLYRDGSDSVAWHGDRIRNRRRHAVVGVVTLGEARPFLVRPAGGGASRRFEPGAGDLIVMGGACQRDWEHTVPKVRSAGARISVTFRSRSAVVDSANS